MYYIVCQLQVSNRIPVNAFLKVFIIMIKTGKPVMEVKHRGNAIKAISIKMKFFHPIACVGQQEFFYFPFSIIKELGIPASVITSFSRMKILMIATIEFI